ncbi:GntR family transcriptional regulator [Alteribacter natronophilus]|uniref:GntR family transcriptional regulator n=1 Tax=Alteribacter natronophilus TaxID=2583810 RepID=UPI00110E3532|nr:GntR family transcriptional regulator [Alteribacter natronophilus]TMW72841.1 GntR family transcriptional regulator [Alteribacter natronophilus]
MKGITFQKPLYEQVYEDIKDNILTGKLAPGSRIVSGQLAEQYQISRTPLREALRQLQIEGLLENDKAGLRVVKIDAKDFEELCDCRLYLEKEVIRLVAEEATDDQLQEINKVLEHSEKEINSEGSNHKKILELNAEFHRLVIDCCSNKRLIQLVNQVRSVLLIYRGMILRDESHNKEILEEHKMIFNSITERDKERAAEAIEMHLTNDKIRGNKMLDQGRQDTSEKSL